MTTVYAIRHRPSGGFLLASPTGRGQTHMETAPLSAETRLFDSVKAARCSLRWWLKGAVCAVRNYGYDDYDRYDEDWKTVERPERRAEYMEVVELNLTAHV